MVTIDVMDLVIERVSFSVIIVILCRMILSIFEYVTFLCCVVCCLFFVVCDNAKLRPFRGNL